MPNQEESIAKSVKRASEFPDDNGKGGANLSIPQLFKSLFPIPQGEPVVDDEHEPNNERIAGLPQYNFRARFERFVIGQQIIGGSKDAGFEYQERDDSVKYEALMDRILDGDAIMRWEERKTLNDGTMVISVSYMVPKAKAKESPEKSGE